MSGRIVHKGDHVCGVRPTAVRAGAVWECDDCGQEWVYRPPREGYVSWSGCWIPGVGWRWEKLDRKSETTQRRSWWGQFWISMAGRAGERR